ncbi:37S ribosomal protein Mrp17 [Trichophyton verrucosum HKI 0517]|uniref:37S ribosomal protein Mrp17 n=1 Tax=Trichophyton verrucosum (strain HKI 0517) TaxID=663202 RepID=D4DIP7_TRIVH|nr:37S ribosomal protein Mrp17 [Trichophyton verrucosum HKI 0517]EFE38280.1 37S ribosomal protein Mrp17 [Trichophyton verrucosum HKI 0517]
MRFDAAAPVQKEMRRTLGLDPRMIRYSVVKLGSTLKEVKDVPGRIEWNNTKIQEETFGNEYRPSPLTR